MLWTVLSLCATHALSVLEQTQSSAVYSFNHTVHTDYKRTFLLFLVIDYFDSLVDQILTSWLEIPQSRKLFQTKLSRMEWIVFAFFLHLEMDSRWQPLLSVFSFNRFSPVLISFVAIMATWCFFFLVVIGEADSTPTK